MSTNMVEPEGPQMTLQYGAYKLHAGYAKLHAHMRMHTPTRPGTRMHARAFTHTQTRICNSYLLLFHGNNDSECASVWRYTYIACLFYFVMFLNDHPVEQPIPVSSVQPVPQRRKKCFASSKHFFALVTENRCNDIHLHSKFQIQQLAHKSTFIGVEEFEAKTSATSLPYVLQFFTTT
jgi:hypothetical protein